MTDLLDVPPQVGRLIVDKASLLACPLLNTDSFLRFCRDRGIALDRGRLLRLERLGVFAPVFRVRVPPGSARCFHIPTAQHTNWFDKGWAWDTTAIPRNHRVPADKSTTQEGYYSIFQVDWLRRVLDGMTVHIQMDGYLIPGSKPALTRQRFQHWLTQSRRMRDHDRTHRFRPAIALLCQYISNRYYPHAVGDQRTVRTGSGFYVDRWIQIRDPQWSWEDYSRAWDPQEVATRFALTPQKLEHAYRTLSSSKNSIDPLDQWSPLVQFVALDQRRKLKGGALLAQTLREGALMLQRLYRDLYGRTLPLPHQVNAIPRGEPTEQEVRPDIRRSLEYTVNQYGLNPQPKLVLFVEGQSEEHVVQRLLNEYFGIAAGALALEIVNVRGVDNATGTKEDRFRALLRLVDYLHHHQTLALILLDNENNASKLKQAAKTSYSLFGHRKRITRPEYVHVWKQAFELDNFSSTELALALTRLSRGKHTFTAAEVAGCRTQPNPGKALATRYQLVTGRDLPKLEMADALVDQVLSPQTRRSPANRPIVKLLLRALRLAALNHLPTQQEIWRKNQTSRIMAKKA